MSASLAFDMDHWWDRSAACRVPSCGAAELLRLDRRPTPEQQAKVFAFLASDDSAGINGQGVKVEAGLLSHQPMVADMLALVSVAMKKYPLVAKWRYPLVAR